MTTTKKKRAATEKTEDVQFLVTYRITYSNRAARKEAVQVIIDDLPSGIWSSYYTAKRKKPKLARVCK